MRRVVETQRVRFSSEIWATTGRRSWAPWTHTEMRHEENADIYGVSLHIGLKITALGFSVGFRAVALTNRPTQIVKKIVTYLYVWAVKILPFNFMFV